ncbi:hypothetical protein GCM10027168_45480 [Streptomyces capparidis]
MDTPAATVGNPADLLHVQVHRVAGPAGGDLAWRPVAGSARTEEPAASESQPGRMPCDGAAVDRVARLGRLVGDPLRGPLLPASPGFDLDAHRSGDVRYRAGAAGFDEATSAFDGQWCVAVRWRHRVIGAVPVAAMDRSHSRAAASGSMA